MRFFITIVLLLSSIVFSFAQNSVLEFKENKGQWNENVLYKARIPGGNLYLENKKLTYQFYNEKDILRMDEVHHGFLKNPQHQDSIINLHAFNVNFLNAQDPVLSPSIPRADYENYFVGNDKSKWANQVRKYETVNYQNLYEEIDLKFYLKDNYLKYDFIVLPKGNPNEIKLQYDGVDKVYLKNGNLYLVTSVNEIIEQKPYAYQLVNGEENEVKCKFELEGNVLSFVFPKGYSKKLPLIIDPKLIFASYSGATIDNWGYTSTFNEAGNLYGGGVSFGIGYPTTTGAYQVLYGGGVRDISISKFTPDGTGLIYSTYLGGSNFDNPHSLIVNSNDELLVFGTTNSTDFPVIVGSYDISQNGSDDMFVAKFTSNGTALLGSTYIGGSGSDGLNNVTPLKYNYADDYRGEIIVDATDNVYVASTTVSTDFPVTAGAIQLANSGLQDACIFKLTPDLTNLSWSSYLGGTADDAAYSLQFDDSGNVLATGGTTSADFPTTSGVIQPSFQGVADGWITKINNSATAIIASTFVGTSDYDQSYFVQLDTGNNVYVVGQTVGSYPITPATVYSVPNSGQFLHKLTPNLNSTVFSTCFGTGSGEVDIALSAFLVNECNYIMISGWGGIVNTSYGMATNSTTNGLPITSNAIQGTTDGSDYYLTMFSEDAVTLMFATFFGGNSSSDHVDGGTSRFDKKGVVYQAVCASCGVATNDFPTSPGAWSNTNNSSNCNLGVFKLDLSALTAIVDVQSSQYHCVDDTVRFQNLSNGGISYFWDFGDGTTSTLFEPVHAYDSVGTYTVMLIIVDSITCLKKDTDYVNIYINPPPIANILSVNPICKGDSIQLIASGGAVYSWQPNYNILNGNTDTATVFPDTTTLYTVIVTDTCGTDTAQILVMILPKNIGISPDTMICLGESVQINASGGGSYLWSPAGSLSNSAIANPIASPLSNTAYNVTITDPNGCVWDTLLSISVDSIMPNVTTSANDSICKGDSVAIYATGNGNIFNWSWIPTNSSTNSSDSLTTVFPLQSTYYVVEAENACGIDYDSLLITVIQIVANIVPDTAVCVGDQVTLWATGGNSYLWTPGNETTSSIQPTINSPTTFTVTISDSIVGCSTNLSVFVDTLEKPAVNLGLDIEIDWGTIAQINATTNGISFWWTPTTGLSCTNCLNPTVTSKDPVTYILSVLGANGCYNYDTITISYNGTIYIPNVFTPDGNGLNDIFFAYGIDIVEFEMHIFDRWGELLYTSNHITKGWNGTYRGKIVQTDTYVWKIKYKDILEKEETLYGRVSLLK